MNTVRAVFFDLDDTLCDAQPAFEKGMAAAFDAIRVRHSQLNDDTLRAAWQAVHAPLFADLASGRRSMAEVRLLRFRHLLTRLKFSNDTFADEVDMLLGTVQQSHLHLFADVPATLAELRRRGFFVGIITNGAGDAHPDSQRAKATHLGLLGLVDAFFTSDEMGHRKPDFRAFLPSLQAANCKPSEMLYVGDSLNNDIAGANGAGMVSVLLQRSEENRPIVQSAKDNEAVPAHIIRSLSQVLPLTDGVQRDAERGSERDLQ